MTTKNPFPGMNPFFEQRWRDAHSSVITYLRDALRERLPPDLIVGAEEEVVTIGAGELATSYRPDVQGREPSALKEPGTTEVASTSPATPATEPIRVVLDDEIERWLEIGEATGRLITVLELISPTVAEQSGPAKGSRSGSAGERSDPQETARSAARRRLRLDERFAELRSRAPSHREIQAGFPFRLA